jgi:hypothetical protein
MRSVRHALVVNGAPCQSIAWRERWLEVEWPFAVQAAVCMIFSESRFAVFRIIPLRNALAGSTLLFPTGKRMSNRKVPESADLCAIRPAFAHISAKMTKVQAAK